MAIKKLTRSKFSAFVPVDESAIRVIVEDMKEHGYDPSFPIIVETNEETGNDEIVDGWHRYQACLRADVEPVTVNLKDLPSIQEDLIEYVTRANLIRRQLKNIPHCLAILQNATHLRDKNDRIDFVRKFTGASVSTINKAIRMKDNLPAKTIKGLLSGAISVGDAEKILKQRLGSAASGTRALRAAPPTQSLRRLSMMEQCQKLEGITWQKVWEEAIDHYHAFVMQKHSNDEPVERAAG